MGVLKSICFNGMCNEIPDMDGYYPNLHVGTADQLLADTYTTDEEPYHYRQTPSHAGTREMDEIVGGSVVWNQLLNKSKIIATQTISGVTITNDGSGYVAINGTATDNIDINIIPYVSFPRNSHKLLITFSDMPANSGIYVTGYGSGSRSAKSFMWARSDATNWNGNLGIYIPSGTTFSNYKTSYQLFDLTAMLGTTIADYIYDLEQATAGAGVEFFRKYFPDDYYAYDAGTLKSVEGLQSHDTVGFNQWDEEFLNGYYSSSGVFVSSSGQLCSKNMIRVLPDTSYYFKLGNLSENQGHAVCFYDANKNFLSRVLNNYNFITPSDCFYININIGTNYGATYNHDICINLSDSAKNGTYEPYTKHTYPLDSTVTLRGIPTLVDGQFKFDGDTYSTDGTVTRRYGIVDLGTLNWAYFANRSRFNAPLPLPNETPSINIFCSKYIAVSSNIAIANMDDKTIKQDQGNASIYLYDSDYTDVASLKSALTGSMLIYKLATPTTEQAEPYQSLQICSPYGTEEYVTTGIVPIGHYTKYPTDLKSIVEQIADAPSADGTYTLKATVSNGAVTYSWESA